MRDADPDGVRVGVVVGRHIASSPEKLKVGFRVAPDGTGPTSSFANVPPAGGAKDYHVAIVKDKNSNPAGLESYSSTMECKDVNGNDSGAGVPILKQDQ